MIKCRFSRRSSGEPMMTMTMLREDAIALINRITGSWPQNVQPGSVPQVIVVTDVEGAVIDDVSWGKESNLIRARYNVQDRNHRVLVTPNKDIADVLPKLLEIVHEIAREEARDVYDKER